MFRPIDPNNDFRATMNPPGIDCRKEKSSLKERALSVVANSWVLLLPCLAAMHEILSSSERHLWKSGIVIGIHSSLSLSYLFLSYLFPREMRVIYLV